MAEKKKKDDLEDCLSLFRIIGCLSVMAGLSCLIASLTTNSWLDFPIDESECGLFWYCFTNVTRAQLINPKHDNDQICTIIEEISEVPVFLYLTRAMLIVPVVLIIMTMICWKNFWKCEPHLIQGKTFMERHKGDLVFPVTGGSVWGGVEIFERQYTSMELLSDGSLGFSHTVARAAMYLLTPAIVLMTATFWLKKYREEHPKPVTSPETTSHHDDNNTGVDNSGYTRSAAGARGRGMTSSQRNTTTQNTRPTRNTETQNQIPVASLTPSLFGHHNTSTITPVSTPSTTMSTWNTTSISVVGVSQSHTGTFPGVDDILATARARDSAYDPITAPHGDVPPPPLYDVPINQQILSSPPSYDRSTVINVQAGLPSVLPPTYQEASLPSYDIPNAQWNRCGNVPMKP